MSLLASLFCVRIPITGESAFLEKVTSAEALLNFLHASPYSVIVFGDMKYVLDFMDFGISRNYGKIRFRTAPSKLAERFQCDSMPCIRAFQNTTMINIPPPQAAAGDFAVWLNRITHFRSYRFHCTEQLRFAFSSGEPVVLVVDENEPSSSVPPSVPINYCSSELLNEYGIKDVTPGTYVFNPVDHMLKPLDRPFQDLMDTPFITADPELIQQRPLWLGYFGGDTPEEASLATKAFPMMEKLYPKFADRYTFSVVNNEEMGTFYYYGRLNYAKFPFFAVFDTSSISQEGRWTLQKHEAAFNDPKLFEKWLSDIANGKEPHRLISAPDPDPPADGIFEEVSTGTLSKLYNDDYDAVIVLTAPWCKHCAKMKPFLNATAHLLASDNKNLKFFWMDGTSNQLPNDFPKWSGYPSLIVFPAGNKAAALQFPGKRRAGELIQFINEQCKNKVNISNSDLSLLKPYEKPQKTQ